MIKMQIILTFFSLHLSHIHSNNMWNQMEFNYHIVALFVMQYIHIMDVINHVFMSSHEKTKTVTVSMRTVSIPNIDVKV